METRLLETGGFLFQNHLTEKAYAAIARLEQLERESKSKKKLLETVDIPEAMVVAYRELFPTGKFDSGKSARQSIRELTDKFKGFWQKHPEFNNWELILDATKLYLAEKAKVNYAYAICSAYFISKENSITKQVHSELAAYCDRILDGEQQTEQADIAIYSLPKV